WSRCGCNRTKTTRHQYLPTEPSSRMSAFARHRTTLIACAALLAAPAAFAAAPSTRTATRMAYDAKTSHTILFGGTTKVDSGTRPSYDLADTWEWHGDRWIRRFLAHSPAGR